MGGSLDCVCVRACVRVCVCVRQRERELNGRLLSIRMSMSKKKIILSLIRMQSGQFLAKSFLYLISIYLSGRGGLAV